MKRLIGRVVAVCVAAATLAAAASDTTTVRGSGKDSDSAEALKAALQDAIENAVGMLVDAEQEMRNYELVKDEILTHSNAYVEDYEVIDTSEMPSGLVKTTIEAKVRKQALVNRISGKKAAKTFSAGRSLKGAYAKDATLARRGGDGAKLLAKELAGLNVFAAMCDVSLVSPEPVVLTKKGDRTEVAYLMKLEIDRERYFKEFLPSLERTLAQVSVSEPVSFVASVKGLGDDDILFKEYIKREDVEGKTGGGSADTFKLESKAFGGQLDEKQYMGLGVNGTMRVAVVSTANKSLTLVEGKVYTLDDACRDAVVEWLKSDGSTPSYSVSFLDGDGEELAAGTAKFGSVRRHRGAASRSELAPDAVWDVTGAGGTLWLVTPWIGSDATAYYQWFKFVVGSDDLPNIESIKVDFAE